MYLWTLVTMKVEIDSVAGSPEGSMMSISSVSNPGTPGSTHYRMANLSTSTSYEMTSDSLDSDMENNNVFGLSVQVKQENFNLNSENCEELQTTPKKKRYTKSRVRNRSPALVQRLKKTRRSKANDRERSRMHSLNDSLDSLRKILPNHGEENKLTKIETLRYAYNYIFALRETLTMLDRGESIDIEDTLYSAQMSAAMKMPTASETLSQLNQHQHQRQQMSPLSVQSQLSPVDHHQQVLHPMTSPHAAVDIKPMMSPPVSPVDHQAFNERIPQCYPTVSQCSPVLTQAQEYSQHQHPATTVSSHMQDYSQYSNLGPWNAGSCATSVFSLDSQHLNQRMSFNASPANGFQYLMVNNF